MREWGCEGCHTPHFAATAEQLLNFTDDPPTPFGCTSCHGTDPHAPLGTNAATGATSAVAGADGSETARPDIARQVSKISSHPESASVRSGLPRGRGVGSRAPDEWLGCIECHDPHRVNDFAAELPYVSGLLAGVLGVDRNGAEVATATYEYEICFRCHGDNTPDAEFVPRVVASTNTRLDFDAEQSVVPSGRRDGARRRRAEPAVGAFAADDALRPDRLHLLPRRRRRRVTRAARLGLSADPRRALRHRRRHRRELRELRPLLSLP